MATWSNSVSTSSAQYRPKEAVKQDFLYSVERQYSVSIERLWAAWTEASQLEHWYSPTILSVLPGSAISETKVGGVWAIAVDVSANGFNAYFWGRYSIVEPLKQLVHSLHYSQDEAEFVLKDVDTPAHKIVIDFEERTGQSWVRFSQFGEMPAEQAEASRQGMESYLDSLENFLAN
jgi:uncharacterized protein YndB with AHSA1/START domain